MTKLNLKLELREPETIFFGLVLPIFLTIVLGAIFARDRSEITFEVGVYELDETVYEEIAGSDVFDIKMYENKEDALEDLEDAHINLIFTSSIDDRDDIQVIFNSLYQSDYEEIVEPILQNLSFTTRIEQLSEGNESEGAFNIEGGLIDGNVIDFKTAQLMAFILQSIVIFNVINTSIGLTRLKQNNILRRFYSLPVKKWQVLLSHILGSILITILQICILILITYLIFDIDIQYVPITLLLLLFSTIGFIGIGLAIAAVARRIEVANSLSNTIVFPMIVAGGGWVPQSLFPEFVSYLDVINPFGSSLDIINAFAASPEVHVGYQHILTVLIIFIGAWAFGIRRFSMRN